MAVGAHDCHFLSASLLSGSGLPCWLPFGRFWSTFLEEGRFPGINSLSELSSDCRARFFVSALDGLEYFKVLGALAGPETPVDALPESRDERRMLSMIECPYVSITERSRQSSTTRENIKIARARTAFPLKPKALNPLGFSAMPSSPM